MMFTTMAGMIESSVYRRGRSWGMVYESPAPRFASAEALNAGAGRPVAVKCCRSYSVRSPMWELEIRASQSES